MENILEPEKNHLIAAHLFPVDQQTDSWIKRCSPVNINIYYVYFIKTLIIELMLTLMMTCDIMTISFLFNAKMFLHFSDKQIFTLGKKNNP